MTSASRYVTSALRYQSRSSMYIRGLIPPNSTELAEGVSIALIIWRTDVIRSIGGSHNLTPAYSTN